MVQRTCMPRGVGGRGPANIMRHLRGITFPARRKDILDHAREKEHEEGYKGTSLVCSLFERLPERYYASVSDVLKAVLTPDAKQSDLPYTTKNERNIHE